MELNHVRRGSGDPLVLIHPLGAELVVWEPVLGLLAARRDVIAVDLPGFGGSPSLNSGSEPTPTALAGKVASFLAAVGVERPHVAGNSLGGWVALELAKAIPVRSVTGLSTAGFWSRPLGPRPAPVRKLGRALLPLLPLLVASEGGRRRLLGGTMAHPERVPARAAARLVRAYLTAPGFEAANAAMRSAVFSGIEEIDAPVTLAWADRDRLVGPPRRPPAGVRMVALRGCGHVPTWDDPRQVAEVLLAASPARA